LAHSEQLEKPLPIQINTTLCLSKGLGEADVDDGFAMMAIGRGMCYQVE
jgi:hypothetical protein